MVFKQMQMHDYTLRFENVNNTKLHDTINHCYHSFVAPYSMTTISVTTHSSLCAVLMKTYADPLFTEVRNF